MECVLVHNCCFVFLSNWIALLRFLILMKKVNVAPFHPWVSNVIGSLHDWLLILWLINVRVKNMKVLVDNHMSFFELSACAFLSAQHILHAVGLGWVFHVSHFNDARLLYNYYFLHFYLLRDCFFTSSGSSRKSDCLAL
uniref:Post-GPI attachment to proteins factor 3 n=1 Tax=Ascaris lumbricoides TaxID=6252 RepID=A0A9J2PE23_ASCLU